MVQDDSQVHTMLQAQVGHTTMMPDTGRIKSLWHSYGMDTSKLHKHADLCEYILTIILDYSMVKEVLSKGQVSSV